MQAEGSVCKEGASIFEIARFALASVLGNTVGAYKKAVALYESRSRQIGGKENSY